MESLVRDDAAACLRTGGVLLLPTDTLPGFHARADDAVAVARIIALKGRRDGKPLLVVAASLEQAAAIVKPLADWQIACCNRCWPGPFSLILPAGVAVSTLVTAGGTTVAVRVPARAGLRDLVASVGFPLVSTSANRNGEPPHHDLREAVAAFGDGIDGWWTDGAATGADVINAGPSAVVDVTVRPPVVLRPGPRPWPGAGDGGS